mgnify:FL=1
MCEECGGGAVVESVEWEEEGGGHPDGRCLMGESFWGRRGWELMLGGAGLFFDSVLTVPPLCIALVSPGKSAERASQAHLPSLLSVPLSFRE